MVGIPGKFDVSGDQVFSLYHDGEIDKIKEYCESDVLNTYWLYLKYELLKGNILFEDYLQNLDIMSEKIPTDKSYSQVFIAGVKRELQNIS
jgi:predicted PolB exonuclease-like 3'-5' exonuclease